MPTQPNSKNPKTNSHSDEQIAMSPTRAAHQHPKTNSHSDANQVASSGSQTSSPTSGTAPQPSIFTKIIRGEIPCYKIYEDDKTFAFLDINPETKGHTLVVPKLQVDKLYELPDEDYLALMLAAKKLSQHLEAKTGARIVWKVVGTDVPHAHIHLQPLDETWFHGRHLAFTPEEFATIQHDLAYPA